MSRRCEAAGTEHSHPGLPWKPLDEPNAAQLGKVRFLDARQESLLTNQRLKSSHFIRQPFGVAEMCCDHSPFGKSAGDRFRTICIRGCPLTIAVEGLQLGVIVTGQTRWTMNPMFARWDMTEITNIQILEQDYLPLDAWNHPIDTANPDPIDELSKPQVKPP
jgi:hypothetical protein